MLPPCGPAVMLFVVESGLSVSMDEVRSVGPRAAVAAASGVVAPVALTVAALSGAFGTDFTDSLAAGAALAPTSLGFSAQLLTEAGQLATPLGQFICTAAVVDDVLSLCLLAEVRALRGSPGAWDLVVPMVASLASLVIGVALALLLPRRLSRALDALRPAHRPACTTLAVLVLAAGAASAASAAGSSDLLGCFVAGLAFSAVPGARAAWDQHVAPFTPWGAR